MDQPRPTEFRHAPTPFGLVDALSHARRAMATITDQPIDAVPSCTRGDDGIWRVRIDVIEVPARMGDNDLLAVYEVEIAPGGDLAGFRRLARYHREDGDGF